MTPTASPWAVLLCKFKDDLSEPLTRQYYEDLFTVSGLGTQNMVDFFRDVSHGKLDLSGSRVFGWYTLDKNHLEYSPPDDRDKLLGWARDAAAAGGVNVGEYVGYVVCMNVPTFSG